jgi:hypothetical protein
VERAAQRFHDMKERIYNMEKNKKLLREEDSKLQRIEDELKVANSELIKIKDSTDAPEKKRVLANLRRLL